MLVFENYRGWNLRKAVFLLCILVLTSKAFAQESDSTNSYWMTLGFFINPVDNSELTGNFDLNYKIKDFFYKVGFFAQGGVLKQFGESGYSFRKIDISIGKRILSEWFHSSLFIGPTFIYGEKEQTMTNYTTFNTVGLEANLQLLLRIANEVGIGFGIYGNINYEHSFAGASLYITIGNGK
ncbi:MAG: hypothetical protein GXX85_10185 [Ignavibacteria bacterium]|nr:hypothetical protein [Ignavibacteria bacterium]